MNIIKPAILATSIFFAAFAAHAFDWKVCEAEIAKFCPGETDNEKIWSCLQKNDIDLSETCDNEGHSKYEEESGKKK